MKPVNCGSLVLLYPISSCTAEPNESADSTPVPISTAFQAILIKELTHFHTPEMDALMAKIGPPNTLTVVEQERLAVLLNERMKDMGPLISDSERDAARILPAIMKRAKIEQNVITGAEETKVSLVSVAMVVGVPNVKTEN